MNPTPEQLDAFAERCYGGFGFLDLEPQPLDPHPGFLVTLTDHNGWDTVDELTFADRDTALRFIDWLGNNAEEIEAIIDRTFTP